MRARRIALFPLAGLAWLLLSVPSSSGQTPGGSYRVFRPDGRGPHPAIVFASGCDGFAPPTAPTRYERRAEQLRAQGYVVVFADYLGRRGLKSCAAGAVTHEDAAREVVATAVWLRPQPGVDGARITAMGWSYGGRGVLVALGTHPEDRLGFSRAVVYYPDCRALPPWKTALPVLMLLGGDDDMTPAKLCQEAVKAVAVPSAVRIVVYPGALHGFDVSELPARMKYGFASVGYQADAADAAQKEVEQFLRPAR